LIFANTGTAIDIGYETLKILNFKKKSDKIQIKNLKILSLPPSIYSGYYLSSEIKDTQTLQTTLSSLLKNINPGKTGITLSDSFTKLFLFDFDADLQSELDLQDLIAWRIKNIIKTEEFYFVYRKIKNQSQKLKIIAEAIGKKFYTALKNILKECKIFPEIINTNVIDAMNFLIKSENITDSLEVLFYIGARLSTILIFNQNELFYIRNIEMGMDIFKETIAKKLELKKEEAEILLKTTSFIPVVKNNEDEPNITDILDRFDIIGNILNRLLRSLQDTISHFKNEYFNLPLSKIVLAGGGAELINLDIFIKEYFEVPVLKLQPLNFICDKKLKSDIKNSSLAALAGISYRI